MKLFVLPFCGVELAQGSELRARSTKLGNTTVSTVATVATRDDISPGKVVQFGNKTFDVLPQNTSLANRSGLADLNNATECWPYYWSVTKASSQWVEAHRTWYTTTSTWKDLKSITVAHQPTGNSTWQTYCDGLPRFQDTSELSSAITTLSSPVTIERTVTALTFRDDDVVNPYDYRKWPACTIKDTEECDVIGSMFVASLRSSLDQWSSKSVLTISVPSTPTAIIVNGKTTPLSAAPGQLPALPLQGASFPASPDGRWSIHPAYSFFADTTIKPGQEVTFTWNYGDITSKPFGPWSQGCSRPSNIIDEPACSTVNLCTIQADHVELIYFPPPSTERDMCAITSVGFDRYSQSIYSHPHVSTVMNSTTFWMDKAYVRYNTISAYKWCSFDNGLGQAMVGVGGTYTSTYVEIESRDASTMCGWQYNVRPYKVIAATPYPLNFADLNGPVPLSAYTCIPGVGGDEVIEDRYLPALAVPPQLRALDPEWAGCVPFFEGTPDPPIALAPVSVLTEDGPTTTERAATPGRSVPRTHPQSTGNPEVHPTRLSAGGVPTLHTPIALSSVPVLTTSFTISIPLTTERPQSQDTDPKPPITDPGNNKTPKPNHEAKIPAHQPITTIAGRAIFISPSEPGKIIVVEPASTSAKTMDQGGAPIVISGTTLSMTTSETGTALVITGHKNLVPFTSINGQPAFIDPAAPGEIVIGDPNGQAHSLTTVSLNNGMAVVDGTTISIQGASATPTDAMSPIILDIAGFKMQLLADGTLQITTQKGARYQLAAGGQQISVDGHTIFFDLEGRAVVVDGELHGLDFERTALREVKEGTGVENVVVFDPNGRRTTIRVEVATVGVNESNGRTESSPTGNSEVSQSEDGLGVVDSPTRGSNNGGSNADSGPSGNSKKSAAIRRYGHLRWIRWAAAVSLIGALA